MGAGPHGGVHGSVPGKPHGVDRIVDQVVRLEAFRGRHKGVLITSPRQNGNFLWKAKWTATAADPEDDGAVCETTHSDLRLLLNYLEDHFGGPS